MNTQQTILASAPIVAPQAAVTAVKVFGMNSRFGASVYSNGATRFLGSFATETEASAAVNSFVSNTGSVPATPYWAGP
jgi:hypothetical protein